LYANQPDSSKTFIFFPKELNFKQLSFSTEINFALLPKRLTEEIQCIPFIYFNFRYGLKDGYSLYSLIKTSYFYNELSLGMMKSFSFSNISTGVSNDMVYWFGFLKDRGFNSSSFGFMTRPNISIGTNIDDSYLTLKSGLIIILGQKDYFGEYYIKRKAVEIGEVNLSLILEQPLRSSNALFYKIGLVFVDTKKRFWLHFPLTNKWDLYYEFAIGYKF
jgi:hypothetical protein